MVTMTADVAMRIILVGVRWHFVAIAYHVNRDLIDHLTASQVSRLRTAAPDGYHHHQASQQSEHGTHV